VIDLDRGSIPCLPAICAGIAAAILLAGLWPGKFSITNEVSWLEGRNGLRFQRFGIAYCPEPIAALNAGSGEDRSLSIELGAKAEMEPSRYLPRILSLYDDVKGEACIIGQWRSGIVLRSRAPDTSMKRAFRETSARNALPKGGKHLITVVSGKSGTSIYVDGKLEKADKGFVLLPDDRQRPVFLVLGNSPDGKSPWEGEISGLAIYGRQLTPAEIAGRYRAWSGNGAPYDPAGMEPVLRYPFDERAGSSARNSVGSGYNLEIPSAFNAPNRIVLAHDFRDLRLGRSSLKDIVVNVAGFIPFGFFFLAWLSKPGTDSKGRKAFSIILIGFGISLAIELVQAHLPARDSSAIDVVCNTLGTAVGVFLFKAARFLPDHQAP
jgi:hypothetical protein